MNTEDVPAMWQRLVPLADLALKFGRVSRATQHPDGTPESDTTHTVMLGLIAMELAPFERVNLDTYGGIALKLDVAKVLRFVLVHDLVETYAGDTPTAVPLGEDAALDKAWREQRALQRITRELTVGEYPAETGARTAFILQDYERQDTFEARWVRVLDKLMPKLTHILNGGAALPAQGVTTLAQVRELHAAQGAKLRAQYPEFEMVHDLFDWICELTLAHLTLCGFGNPPCPEAP